MNTLVCVCACACACVRACVYRFVAEAEPQEVQRYDSEETLVQGAPDLDQDQTTGPDHRESFRTRRATPSQ